MCFVTHCVTRYTVPISFDLCFKEFDGIMRSIKSTVLEPRGSRAGGIV